MPFKLTVDVPSLGSQTLEIPGLGLFENGTYDITDEQAAAFQARQPSVDQGGFDNDPKSPTFGSYIPKIVPGPDLMTAAKGMHGITVEEVTGSNSGTNTGNTTNETPVIINPGDAEPEHTGTTPTTNSPVGSGSAGPASDTTGGN